MRENEFLVELMQRKALEFERVTGIPGHYYFNKQDELDLMTALDNDLDKLIEELPSHYYCPFCVVWRDDCDECPYGLRHGQCGETGSTFSMIMDDYESHELSFIGMAEKIYLELREELV